MTAVLEKQLSGGSGGDPPSTTTIVGGPDEDDEREPASLKIIAAVLALEDSDIDVALYSGYTEIFEGKIRSVDIIEGFLTTEYYNDIPLRDITEITVRA